jgi:hypothetical protein
MATPSATEEMERLQLSDEDTEELWNSPSQRRTRPVTQRTPASADRLQNQDTKPALDQEEARELALRNELQTVRNVNQAIEGVLESLERARGNMEVCNFCQVLGSAANIQADSIAYSRLGINSTQHMDQNPSTDRAQPKTPP